MFTSHVLTISLEMPLPQAFIISSLSGVSWMGFDVVSILYSCQEARASTHRATPWLRSAFPCWRATESVTTGGTGVCGRWQWWTFVLGPVNLVWKLHCSSAKGLYPSAKHANGAGTEWIITETTVDPPQAFTLNVLPESVSSDKGAPLGNGAGPWLVIAGCSRCGYFVGLEGSQLSPECQSRAIRSSWIAMFLFSFPHRSLY